MNKTLDITEQEYRNLPCPSYSLLKRLAKNGKKALTEEVVFKNPELLTFGDLVDCMLFTPEEVEEKFYFKPIKYPTGQIKELADYVVTKYPDKDYTIESILQDSKDLNIFGRKKDETRITTFDIDDFWNYIDHVHEAKGKKIFSEETKEKADYACSILCTSEKSAWMFQDLPEGEEFIDQMKIVFPYIVKKLKVMLDKTHINHNNKTIQPIDLKCTEFRLKSFPYVFVDQMYYLQATTYTLALRWLTRNDERYKNYTVLPFKFLVYSKYDQDVHIWTANKDWLNVGLVGKEGMKRIAGVNDLLTDYVNYVKKDYNVETFITENKETIIPMIK